MFDIFYIGKKPNLFPHERPVESIEQASELTRTRFCWIVNYLSDYTHWDWLWEPVPWQKDFVHVWPSQHYEFSGTYLVPKQCTDLKYHFHKKVLPNRSRPDEFLCRVVGADFDWTWAPHPLDPPFNYVFGNQWWPANKMSTVEYRVPGATETKYMTQTATLPPNYLHWQSVHECNWDYSWQPDPGDSPYIYVFGNQWHSAQIMPTMQYHVPGATEFKYMNFPRAELLQDCEPWQIPQGIDNWDCSWRPDPGSPPYRYQFGTQHQKTGGPVYSMPGATDTKFQPHPRAWKTSKDDNWQVPDGVDTETFDWSWHPDATDPPYIYQFGTQHQRTGGPRYVVPGATEIKFVEQIKITTKRTAGQIYVIDHMDGNAATVAKNLPESASSNVTIVRYFDNYLDTLKRIAKNANSTYGEFIWIVSSVCDYSKFDFSWHPEAWQATMLHVFASDDQKFGDTFFMHVPTFVDRTETCKLLEWYDCNYVPDISVPRQPMPVICHDHDSHVTAVQTKDFQGPLALFTVEPHVDRALVTVPLWREQVKTIVPLSQGAGSVIVPKVAVPFVRTQLYDYPFIDKTKTVLSSEPLDIVFIANGESNADSNFLQMRMYLANSKKYKNKVHLVKGINGRVAAYHAAAQAATTSWFFAVFAKLEVDQNFDWLWQPDRMQQAKHYIFHALNPCNLLVYGHQAMIAYNRNLVLGNAGKGLDFTLDSPHEVVPIISGVARYTATAWSAWRTAFRECIKLKASLPDVENEYRLAEWLNKGFGEHGEWSQWGARDAIEYYDQVQGKFEELKKTYEWNWLASYAMIKRSLTTNQ